ncbi:ATP-dependent helicase [Nakamurella flava]|uniref:DNA 3'-5' helicase n=1 Tax=Nakamurella flava TaxID=2576308 RepID=A0A4U6QKM0_9ACTN|nr:ATP-dependent DNA helicase [Nakamurella flava]TKV61057.1 ATP-dependent helicase [Nakamurella flava]
MRYTPALSAAELAGLLGLPGPTPEQTIVIEAPLHPALVVAGAGSGKTETMAARVVFLVANGLVRPDQILGLTFTRKAAAQLAQRVRRRLRALTQAGVPLLPAPPSSAGPDRSAHRPMDASVPRAGESAGEPVVSTYHAFGGRLISEYGALAGVESAATVLTPTAAWQLARRVVARWDGDLDADLSPDAVTERLLAISGSLADHLVEPADLERELDRILLSLQSAPPSPRQKSLLHSGLAKHVKPLQDRRWILPLVRAFRAAKQERGVIDFADQMQIAARLVAEHPGIGESLRDRYRVVLLDEYQDTGHAQRVLLRGVFGAGTLPTSRPGAGPPAAGTAALAAPPPLGHPVTAVGDPVQSIYSWRGASASNLPAFGRDFPLSDGRAAPTFTLLTSFRNPISVLTLANVASAPIRQPGPGTDLPAAAPGAGGGGAAVVGELRPAPSASAGTVRHGLFRTVADEDTWVAAEIAELWRAAGALPRDPGDLPDGSTSVKTSELPALPVGGTPPEPPTTAVLVRRRADMAGIAAALRQQGLPVEVVGLGGLIDEPEVADLIATLRVLVDPTAGAAALRILTGARWRLGPADLEALHRRAASLAGRVADAAGAVGRTSAVSAVRSALGELSEGEDIDAASLVDALADPGDAAAYSTEGHRRLSRLGAELDRLRARLQQPLAELVSDIERTIGVEIEVQLTGGAGRAHLDAFADVVAAVAATGAGPLELLDYVDAAAEREDGLSPGEVPAPAGQVQVLTVHAAKGLEWEIVAVPHLTAGVFPSGRGGTWFGDPSQLPPTLRGDRADLPAFDLPPGADQKELANRLADHVEAFREFRLTEERRLLYVALTRSERVLLLSGHHWGAGTSKPAGPSPFLTELAPVATEFGAPDAWEPTPTDCDSAPLVPRTSTWPYDPLGERRAFVEAGAARVLAALASAARPGHPASESRADLLTRPDAGSALTVAVDADQSDAAGSAVSAADPRGWRRDLTVLLAERAARQQPRIDVPLPSDLSVSRLVDLAEDPAAVAQRLRRPMPLAPSSQARRGQAFHSWLETFFRGDALVGLEELPGAEDRAVGADPDLSRLQDAFRRSDWAGRVPIDIEVPFSTRIAGTGVRGRIDAVFADPDGGITVVDWKTGAPPPSEHRDAGDVQLACYRLAMSELTGIPVELVRAVFHYVGSNRTVAPRRLLDAAGIGRLLASAVVTDAGEDTEADTEPDAGPPTPSAAHDEWDAGDRAGQSPWSA